MKKLTAILLALLLLAMPFAGLAEESADDLFAFLASEEETTNYMDAALEAGRRINTNVTFGNLPAAFSGDPTMDQVITDVLNALSFSGYAQGDEGYFAIGMKQPGGTVAEILTMGVATADSNAYIASNLLGGTIVIGADEVETLINRLLDVFVKSGLMEETDAQEIKTMLPEMVNMVKAELETAMNQAQLDVTKLKFDALINAVMPLLGKIETAEVTMQPKNCDPAASVVTVEITPDEAKSIVAALFKFIQDNPELAEIVEKEMDFGAFAAQNGFDGTFDDFLTTIQGDLEKETLLESNIVAKLWLDEAGMPVAAECTVEEAVINYTRLTMNQGPAHSVVLKAGNADITVNVLVGEKSCNVTLAMAEDGVTFMDMALTYADLSTDAAQIADVDFTMMVEDITVRVAYDSNLVMNGVDFTSKETVTIGVNEVDYVTVFVDCETTDAGASIMTGDVVRPAEMSDADFANWFAALVNNLQTWLFNALFAMPASVLELL